MYKYEDALDNITQQIRNTAQPDDNWQNDVENLRELLEKARKFDQLVERIERAKWKGECCPNPDKGWIINSHGNRLTRLGNRNAFGKIITAHNNELDVLAANLTREDTK